MRDEALALRVVHKGGRAAERRPRARRAGIVEPGPVQSVEESEVWSEGAIRCLRALRRLMVADQDRRPVGSGEGGHSVVSVGDEEAVAHPLTPSRDDAVAESLGQGDDTFRIVDEGPEAASRQHAGGGCIRAGASEAGEAEGYGGSRAEKPTT